MDAARFDALVRSLDTLAPRRAALALFGGGLSTVLTRVGIEDVAGKNKKKKRKMKRKCKGNTKKCGKKCIPKEDCCNAADCGSAYTCNNGVCVCLSDPVDIPCTSGTCCDPATDEICAITESSASCEAGGCVPIDYCSDENLSICGLVCDCVTSVEDQTVCSDFFGLCEECTTDDDCTVLLAAPAICVQNGEFCTACTTDTFCIFADCPDNAVERRTAIASRLPGNELRRLR